jgi:hypothetical protein
MAEKVLPSLQQECLGLYRIACSIAQESRLGNSVYNEVCEVVSLMNHFIGTINSFQLAALDKVLHANLSSSDSKSDSLLDQVDLQLIKEVQYL